MKEMYSSRVKDFSVKSRQAHPKKDAAALAAAAGAPGSGTAAGTFDYSRTLDSDQWVLLGNFTAENRKGVHRFAMPRPRPRSRYLLLHFHTHYGNEEVCALNSVRAMGVTAARELEAALARQLHAGPAAAAAPVPASVAASGPAASGAPQAAGTSHPGHAAQQPQLQPQHTSADADVQAAASGILPGEPAPAPSAANGTAAANRHAVPAADSAAAPGGADAGAHGGRHDPELPTSATPAAEQPPAATTPAAVADAAGAGAGDVPAAAGSDKPLPEHAPTESDTGDDGAALLHVASGPAATAAPEVPQPDAGACAQQVAPSSVPPQPSGSLDGDVVGAAGPAACGAQVEVGVGAPSTPPAAAGASAAAAAATPSAATGVPSPAQQPSPAAGPGHGSVGNAGSGLQPPLTVPASPGAAAQVDGKAGGDGAPAAAAAAAAVLPTAEVSFKAESVPQAASEPLQDAAAPHTGAAQPAPAAPQPRPDPDPIAAQPRDVSAPPPSLEQQQPVHGGAAPAAEVQKLNTSGAPTARPAVDAGSTDLAGGMQERQQPHQGCGDGGGAEVHHDPTAAAQGCAQAQGPRVGTTPTTGPADAEVSAPASAGDLLAAAFKAAPEPPADSGSAQLPAPEPSHGHGHGQPRPAHSPHPAAQVVASADSSRAASAAGPAPSPAPSTPGTTPLSAPPGAAPSGHGGGASVGVAGNGVGLEGLYAALEGLGPPASRPKLGNLFDVIRQEMMMLKLNQTKVGLGDGTAKLWALCVTSSGEYSSNNSALARQWHNFHSPPCLRQRFFTPHQGQLRTFSTGIIHEHECISSCLVEQMM